MVKRLLLSVALACLLLSGTYFRTTSHTANVTEGTELASFITVTSTGYGYPLQFLVARDEGGNHGDGLPPTHEDFYRNAAIDYATWPIVALGAILGFDRTLPKRKPARQP